MPYQPANWLLEKIIPIIKIITSKEQLTNFVWKTGLRLGISLDFESTIKEKRVTVKRKTIKTSVKYRVGER
ncbi:MAG: hypothetical protein Q8P80_00535 [Candidatus Levybacteria bacterium]|nr:hypothetical protein [Candidatus Levybacteria bacterium]